MVRSYPDIYGSEDFATIDGRIQRQRKAKKKIYMTLQIICVFAFKAGFAFVIDTSSQFQHFTLPAFSGAQLTLSGLKNPDQT